MLQVLSGNFIGNCSQGIEQQMGGEISKCCIKSTLVLYIQEGWNQGAEKLTCKKKWNKINKPSSLEFFSHLDLKKEKPSLWFQTNPCSQYSALRNCSKYSSHSSRLGIITVSIKVNNPVPFLNTNQREPIEKQTLKMVMKEKQVIQI